MTKELILFRHGIAETHGTRPDFDRALTDEGIRKMNAMAEYLADYVKDKDICIVSSPLVRARQTADILAMACGADVTIENWVADGVTSELFEFPEDVLPIVVGHNPTLEEWHYYITKEHEHYKKGSFGHYTMQGQDGQCVHWMTYKKLQGGEHEK